MNILQIPNMVWEKLLRFWAKQRLVLRYEYMIQVSMLMEEFDTDRILHHGEEYRNKDLQRVQQEIKAMSEMIEFLRHKK